MDPFANIEEQREIATALLKKGNFETAGGLDAAIRLAELRVALDEWQQKGGFIPYQVRHKWHEVDETVDAIT